MQEDRHAQVVRIARAFHEGYARLSPAYGYGDHRPSWEHVPEQNRRLTIAVVKELLRDRVITPGEASTGRLMAEVEVLREGVDRLHEEVARSGQLDYERGYADAQTIAADVLEDLRTKTQELLGELEHRWADATAKLLRQEAEE